ncbi:MAG: DUF2071 domain-containing protein [Luteolibacter sp.]
MEFLKRHPFPVVARFRRVVAVSFAFPEEVLRGMVSDGLEVDSYEGLGFVTVAMVWTEGMRPAGFPKVLGQDFFLSGYRIFTRLKDEDGRRLRGLQIIRSETDKGCMVVSGNLMTKYNYRRVDVCVDEGVEGTRVVTRLPGGEVTLDLCFDTGSEAGLPEGSPFPDWRTARRFAGPMPFTFSREESGGFVVIEGSRNSWKPGAVEMKDWKVGLFGESPLCSVEPVLANAFQVEDVEYRWEKGRMVQPGGVG